MEGAKSCSGGGRGGGGHAIRKERGRGVEVTPVAWRGERKNRYLKKEFYPNAFC